MRLIDADALKENVSRTALTITGMRFDKTVLREILIKYRDYVLRTIDEAPTIYAQPVVYGRWKSVDYDIAYECSVCKHPTEYNNLSNYCPHCGAYMKGDK